MLADEFRRLALALPDAVEGAHMEHPDFRVDGKIFASLLPDGATAMVRLPDDEQEAFLAAAPEVFYPAAGAWGRQGSTLLSLAAAPPAIVRDALAAAHRLRRAPQKGKRRQ